MPSLLSLPAPVRGALWMILTAASFAATIVAVRMVSDRLSPFEIVFFRCVVAMAIVLPPILRTGFAPLRTQRLGMHAVRAGLAYLAMLCWFYSVALIPLADVSALQFTQPLFTVVFAVIVLNEVVNGRRWLATVIGFGGALVIIRPGFAEVGLGTMMALSAAALYSAVNIAVKVLARTEPAGRIVFYVNVMLLPLSLVPTLFTWVTPTLEEMLWLVAVGVCGTAAQFFIARALAVADTGVVMPFDFLRLPFVAGMAYVLFGEVPDIWTWVGAVIIFGSSMYLMQQEARGARDRRRDKARPPL